MRHIPTAAACLMALILAPAALAQQGDQATTQWQADIQAQQDAGPTGTARATTSEGQTTVSVDLDGISEGANHPWHIHQGTCGSGGGIVGDASVYTPVRADAGGAGSERATLEMELDPQQDYYVNIHASPQQLDSIVACGQLEAG